MCLVGLAPRTDAAVLEYVGVLRDNAGPFGLIGAHGIDVSPDGQNLYVASFVDHALVVLARDPSNRTASYVETHFDRSNGVEGLMSATSVAVSPDGADVYVASFFADALATFRRDPSDGRLIFHQVFHNEDVAGLSSPRAVALSPDGRLVYAATYYDDSLVVFRRDPSSGRLDHVQTLTNDIGGVYGMLRNSSLTVSPDGANVYVGSEGGNAVATFARAVGAEQLSFVEAHIDGVGGVTNLISPASTTASADGGYVYVLSARAVATFRRDLQTGRLAFVTSSRTGISANDEDGAPTSLTLNRAGTLAFATLSQGDTVSVFSRSTSSGQLALLDRFVNGVAGVEGIAGAHDAVVSPDDGFLYVASQFDDAVATFQINSTACAADCNGSGEVVIEEVVQAVAIAHGELDLSGCMAADVGMGPGVSMPELTHAITRALGGC